MKIYTGNGFSVSIPNSWEGEFDEAEHFDVLYNAQGAGELQFSSVMQESSLSINDLKNIAAEDIQNGAKVQEIELGDFNGLFFDYDLDGDYWCEWYLVKSRFLLFVTYTCPVAEEGAETDDVDLIMGTLKSARQEGMAS